MAKASFHWDDPFLLQQQLSEDERMIEEAARAYCQDKLLPRVTEAFRHALSDAQIAELARYMRQRYAPSQAPWENLEGAVARLRSLQSTPATAR